MIEDHKPIDWDRVKCRIAESERALERSLGGDELSLEAVYRRRAEQLATRREQVTAAGTVSMLVFAMGAERYGLPLPDLVAVLPFANCTPVPGARPELLGVTNVRGEIRSVLDLRRLLELPEGPQGGSGYILLVRHQDQVVGLRVDHLEKAERVSLEDLAAPGEAGTDPHGRYLRGLTSERVIVLDTGAILEHPVFHPANH
jgi:purine-binding chemotaxis protein CheW